MIHILFTISMVCLVLQSIALIMLVKKPNNPQTKINKKKLKFYKQVADANKQLEKLRSICKHPNTEECNYSYGPGRISRAIVCSDCGELIESEFNKMLMA